MYAALLLGSIKYPSLFIISLITGLSIFIMNLVELTPKLNVSASTVGYLLHPNYFRGPFIWFVSNPWWIGE